MNPIEQLQKTVTCNEEPGAPQLSKILRAKFTREQWLDLITARLAHIATLYAS